MVQIIPANLTKQSFSQKLAGGIGRGLEIGSQLYGEHQQKKLLAQEKQGATDAILRLTGKDTSGLPLEMQKEYLSKALQGQNEQAKQQSKYQSQLDLMKQLGLNLGEEEENEPTQGQRFEEKQPKGILKPGYEDLTSENKRAQPSKLIPENKIQAMALINPAVADKMQKHNDNIMTQQRHEEDIEQKRFESERNYHTKATIEADKEIEQLRSVIPKKEMALDFARGAIESGEIGAFSLANLAERTGINELQTAKGAQLITAAKENLLSNMGRVSSKGQNLWFEQRLNSMFPKVGQSEEANLTIQEMLDAEIALDKLYLEEYDRLTESDEKNFGYGRKDRAKRARLAIKPMENHVFNRAVFRMKEIEEQEKGLSDIKKKVGKNVDKGTPLTLAMAKLYYEKYGDEAAKIAEKNGYKIPTLEDYKSFREPSREFREEL